MKPAIHPAEPLPPGGARDLSDGIRDGTRDGIHDGIRPEPALPRPIGLAAVVHGLRNPLAGLRASIQLASQQAAADPELACVLADALAESDRLDARIRALLDLARPACGERRRLETILARVAAALHSRCAAGGLELGTWVDAPVAGLVLPAEPLEEILLELGENALRASERGGRLQLSGRREVSGELLLEVSDSGSGIPEAVRARIFDAFFTTHPAGTGLGLLAARRKAERLGGELELARTDSAGTTFRVRLPIG